MNNNLLIAIVILTAILSLMSAFDIWAIKRALNKIANVLNCLHETDKVLFKGIENIEKPKRKRELANEDND